MQGLVFCRYEAVKAKLSSAMIVGQQPANRSKTKKGGPKGPPFSEPYYGPGIPEPDLTARNRQSPPMTFRHRTSPFLWPWIAVQGSFSERRPWASPGAVAV